MRRCIVHVGMPKTGTTSIQESLFHSKSLGGARYLHAGISNSGSALCSAFGEDPSRIKFNRVQGLTSDEIELRRELTLNCFATSLAHKDETFLVSGEGLINLDVAGFQRMCDWFRQYVDQVQVVGYCA